MKESSNHCRELLPRLAHNLIGALARLGCGLAIWLMVQNRQARLETSRAVRSTGNSKERVGLGYPTRYRFVEKRGGRWQVVAFGVE
jgi:hypothetical protein